MCFLCRWFVQYKLLKSTLNRDFNIFFHHWSCKIWIFSSQEKPQSTWVRSAHYNCFARLVNWAMFPRRPVLLCVNVQQLSQSVRLRLPFFLLQRLLWLSLVCDLTQAANDFLMSRKFKFMHWKTFISRLGVTVSNFWCTSCVLLEILMREHTSSHA